MDALYNAENTLGLSTFGVCDHINMMKIQQFNIAIKNAACDGK